MNTGDRIRYLRTQKKLTLDEVAASLGTIKQTIYKYEHGVVTNISDDKITALAKILDTTPAYLRCLIDDPDPKLNYTDLVQRQVQMEKDILAETKDALDKVLIDRKQADSRLLDAAHKICFMTPEYGISYPDGEKVIGPLNAMRMNVITDFIESNQKYLRILLNAADEAQWKAGGEQGTETSDNLSSGVFSCVENKEKSHQ